MASPTPGILRSRPVFSGLTVFLALVGLVAWLAVPAAARNRKADKYLAQGKDAELHEDWDGALDLYEKALAVDPGDPAYQVAVNHARFEAGAAHIKQGDKLRKQGKLAEALVEFERAYRIDPSSSVAEQEIHTTQIMILREQKKGENSETRALTPSEVARKETAERLDSMLPMPELKPLNPQPINLKMNNQSPKVLFETVGKLAGVNVLFDPEFTAGGKPQSIELNGATLGEALDYVSVITKAFWKPLSSNAIFVTQDNTTKRRDYEEQVMKVFYLTNPTTPQELQEIVTAVRSVADIQRLFVYNAQNAIIARGEADRIALAEKIIHDLDKPKSEVIVDVLVLEVSSKLTRTLGAGIAPNGLSIPISFTPTTNISTPATATTGTTTGSTGTVSTPTTTPTGTPTSNTTSIPLGYIGKVNWNDFSTVLPGATLSAVLGDNGTKVMQSPEIRSVDNQKATLKIGTKEPIASGSFQPGIGGVGINPLVNTQFTFIDVGVNLDLTPKVHDNGEISMHVELEISSVIGEIPLGGITQPELSQEKVIHDVRMKDGEVSLLGGLKRTQDNVSLTGIPLLSSIPVLKWLFSTKTTEKDSDQLVIALIPHIVRRPDYTDENLRGVAVGNATVVKMNYAPPPASAPPAESAPKTTAPAQPGAPAPAPAAPAVPPATGLNSPVTVPPAARTAPAAQLGNATLNFVPNHLDAAMGGPVTVNLSIQNATDLFGAPMHIKFDPKTLRLNDIVQGTLLASDGQQTAFTKNILNDTGEATITLNRLPGAGGVTTAGPLVTLSFTALARGITTVSVPGFTPVNSQGQAIPASSPVLTINVK